MSPISSARLLCPRFVEDQGSEVAWALLSRGSGWENEMRREWFAEKSTWRVMERGLETFGCAEVA